MYGKPLTYDSLKTVLFHLDPNLRFLISIRIPSVRVAERSVPLKIERLHFSNRQFEINETRYSLDVCSEGRDVLFTSSSDSDVNEYGEMDETSKRTVMPGDVVFKPLDRHPTAPDMTEERMNEKIDYYEKYLKNDRMRLALLNSMAPANVLETPESYYTDHMKCFFNGDEAEMRALGNSPEVEKARRVAVSMTEMTIEAKGRFLQPLLNRRDNVRPNFEIQLKITSPSGVRKERVKYTAKLHSAEKSLLKMMFGIRKHIVQVKKLEICQSTPIRFPLGLKMKIRELDAIGNIRRIHFALSGVVVSSSYPLERLEVEFEDEEDLVHEIVKSAKTLIIYSAPFDTPMLQVILNLQNKKVHVSDNETMTNEEHVQLIRRWLEVGKPIGTCYTFEMQNEHEGETILEMAKQQCDRAVVEDKCVVIPMNVNLVLKLSNEFVSKGRHENWMFKMEVLLPGPTLI